MVFTGHRRPRMGVTAATVVAVVCVLVVAGGIAYVYPSLTGGASTSTTSVPGGSRSNITSFTTNTSSAPPVTRTTTTSSQQGWQEWAVANATLGYSNRYLRSAWNYTYHIYQSGEDLASGRYFISNVINALNLDVTGNWTIGYTLNYWPTVINVTVQFTPPSTYYPVIFSHAQNSSLFQESIRFNSTQQKAISIALANAQVKSGLSSYPYFVDDAFLFPSGNKTFGGDYLVWFFQANGPKILGAFVNMNSGAVVATYSQSRVVRTCYPNGACFNSPWWYP